MTLARACAVPAFILMFDHPGWAVSLFIGAMITDALDGIIARRTHTQSTMGVILDPLADKLLLVSAFVMLFRHHQLPEWWLPLVLGRDLFIVTGWTVVYLLTKEVMMPTLMGKLANVAQTTTVILLLIPWKFPGMFQVVGVVMAAATAASGVEYLWRGSWTLWKWGRSRATAKV